MLTHDQYKRMCARSFLYGLLWAYGATDDSWSIITSLEQSVADDFGDLISEVINGEERDRYALPVAFWAWSKAGKATVENEKSWIYGDNLSP